MTEIKILSMNASGKNDTNKRGECTYRRRKVISDLVKKYEPDVVLFQEFKWEGIIKKTWAKTPIPDMYEYAGHIKASIMYNTDVLNVGTPSSDDIDKTVRCLQRKRNTRLGKTLPLNFLPIPRMTIRKVKTKDDSFECISSLVRSSSRSLFRGTSVANDTWSTTQLVEVLLMIQNVCERVSFLRKCAVS